MSSAPDIQVLEKNPTVAAEKANTRYHDSTYVGIERNADGATEFHVNRDGMRYSFNGVGITVIRKIEDEPVSEQATSVEARRAFDVVAELLSDHQQEVNGEALYSMRTKVLEMQVG